MNSHKDGATIFSHCLGFCWWYNVFQTCGNGYIAIAGWCITGYEFLCESNLPKFLCQISILECLVQSPNQMKELTIQNILDKTGWLTLSFLLYLLILLYVLFVNFSLFFKYTYHSISINIHHTVFFITILLLLLYVLFEKFS